MAGRASIVGAAETSVGKVRDHNEDAHYIDPDLGIFLVCDGMGGHAAGEVASELAVSVIRHRWSGPAIQDTADRWLAKGTLETRKELLNAVRDGVTQAHTAILQEAERDKTRAGMGTTLVGAIVVGGDIIFAHAGDSRAYLVRDAIAMQLTEDHTLLARLLAAGVDVDTAGEGSRFKSMLTNALGIGADCKVSTFVVPVADGDRFLLCSDGITEYVTEAEIGEVLTKMPSPARSAQRLVELALQRGGADNATALVVRVLEAGETARPAELLKREEDSIRACPLWAKINPQQRLRALRIALPRDHADGEKIPAQTLGDRVAWAIIDGIVEENGQDRGPGSLLYPEALLAEGSLPDKETLAIAQGEVRALALRADDFRELCEDDPELAEILLESLAAEIALRRPQRRTGKIHVQASVDPLGTTLETAAQPDPDRPRARTDPADPGRAATEPPQRIEIPPPAVAEPVIEAVATPAIETTPEVIEIQAKHAPEPLDELFVEPKPAAESLDELFVERKPAAEPLDELFEEPKPAGEPVIPKRTTTLRAPTEPPPDPSAEPTIPKRTTTLLLRSPTSPPSGGAMLPNVLSQPHPRLPAPPRNPTPAGGVLSRTPAPPVVAPSKGIPSPVHSAEPTQPLASPLKPPAPVAQPVVPRSSRANTPPSGLIVATADRAAADAAVDSVFKNLTVDDSWGDSGPIKKPPTIPPPIAESVVAPSEHDEASNEISMEADEPDERPPPRPLQVSRFRPLNDSEPEISIENLEALADEDEPQVSSEEPASSDVVSSARRPSREITAQPVVHDDSSQPEIQIITPGRAITSNEVEAVSGAIADEPEPAATPVKRPPD